jgi:hypothetical protein
MEAEYGLTQSAMGGNEGDSTLAVKFFKLPVKNQAKSDEAERPIFEELDHIEISQPGNKDTVVCRRIRVGDKERFPEHWRRFVDRTSESEDLTGTLLKEWPQVTTSQVEEFKFYNVRTVEQLAAITDVNLQNIMGGVALKQKAKAFLTQVTSNEELAKQLKVAQAQIAELLANQAPAPVEDETPSLVLTTHKEDLGAVMKEEKPKRRRIKA